MPLPVNVVCVNVSPRGATGGYLGRGTEYVNKLHAGVRRNTTVPFNFYCISDEAFDLAAGQPLYHPGIVIRPVKPPLLGGWWNKMRMFKDHLFYGRVVYLDLDTVITGNIDELLRLQTPFAMLRDLMRPKLKGSGVMAWDCAFSYAASLWTQYERDGCPQDDDEGDQAYIAAHLPVEPDLLQNHIDGIYSYKMHCTEQLPADARVVCFHGQPRPHLVQTEWMRKHWKEGD